MVPALYTLSAPNNTLVYACADAWFKSLKLRSISGTLSALKPRNVAKGISWPSLYKSDPQQGHFLSGKSNPVEYSAPRGLPSSNSKILCLQFKQR